MPGDNSSNPAVNFASTAADSAVTQQSAEQPVPQGETLLTLSVMMVTGLAIILGRSLLRGPRKKVRSSRSRPPLPCESCRFKGDSIHLRCAVHPYRAMTADALDCPDYWAKDSDRFERSLS